MRGLGRVFHHQEIDLRVWKDREGGQNTSLREVTVGQKVKSTLMPKVF